MNKPNTRPGNLRLFWGIALVLAGLGVFYRIPQVLPEISRMAHFSGAIWIIRICLYIMGIVLIVGGLRKVARHMRKDGIQKTHTTDTGTDKTTETMDR